MALLCGVDLSIESGIDKKNRFSQKFQLRFFVCEWEWVREREREREMNVEESTQIQKLGTKLGKTHAARHMTSLMRHLRSGSLRQRTFFFSFFRFEEFTQISSIHWTFILYMYINSPSLVSQWLIHFWRIHAHTHLFNKLDEIPPIHI